MLKGNQKKAFEACARREQQRVFLFTVTAFVTAGRDVKDEANISV